MKSRTPFRTGGKVCTIINQQNHLMRKFITPLFFLLVHIGTKAQVVYSAGMYANTGDTFYITAAQPDTTNFYATGANHAWNFAGLKSISQQQLIYRSPKSTGFTQLQWPYIYNANNVNLSSTNNQSINIGTLQQSNNNDYFLNNTAALALKASSFNIAYGNVSLNVKNVYTQADTLYKFPLQYNDTFASNAYYTTTIPGVYYNTETIIRTNKTDGWGSVTTPYKKFNNCLRIVSQVTQTDTFAFAGIGIPAVTIQYRELKWLDTSTGYPVLYVKQVKTGGIYVTENVQYVDVQQYFKPQALFAYVPLIPVKGDTVTFQNLSTNSTSYQWDFGDGKNSTAVNPQHIYTTAGKYAVKLAAYNGPYADSTLINITVTENSLPLQLLSFSAAQIKNENILQWSTAKETNTGNFVIERSSDGKNFNQLSLVKAAGTSSTILNYSFYDNTPLHSKNYYRLKMVDKDGRYTYSTIIILQHNIVVPETTKLFPNPVKHGQPATLFIYASTAVKAVAYTVNTSGKISGINNLQLQAGANTIYVGTDGLPAGLYFVNCLDAGNHILAHQKLIIMP